MALKFVKQWVQESSVSLHLTVIQHESRAQLCGGLTSNTGGKLESAGTTEVR